MEKLMDSWKAFVKVSFAFYEKKYKFIKDMKKDMFIKDVKKESVKFSEEICSSRWEKKGS